MESVLISTLGDPSAWDPVEYFYGGFSFKSISTLPLFNYLSPKPDAVILVVLDTIIDDKISSYADLVEKVRSKYVSLISLISKETGLSYGQVRIVVSPGVGRFKPKDKELFFNFIGNLSDFYAYTMFEISKPFIESETEVTIHLDLTHGVNFMPSLTLLAIRRIASILALTRRSVRLKVYNAEPYRKNITNRLNIHLVEDSQAVIEYDLIKLGARGGCVLLKHYDKNIICCKEDLNKLKLRHNVAKELNAFLSSVFNGLPLALYTFYPDVTQLESIIEETVKIWRENISITSDGSEVYVRRNLSFDKDYTKLIQIWLIAKTLNLHKKIEVSYDELDNLREKFFSKFSKKINEMISLDLRRVKENVEKNREICEDWVKLKAVFKEEFKDFRERDFLAHSGLEMNVTEVKYDGQTIMLRYAKDEKEKIINGCLHGLL